MFRRIADTLNFHSGRTDLFKINSACSCTIHHQSIGSSSSSSSFFVFRTKSFRSSRRITRINSIWRRVKSFGKQTCNRHRFELILSARRESFHRILGMKRNWCFEVDWKLFWVQTRVLRDFFNNASFLLTAREALRIKAAKAFEKKHSKA